MTEEPPRPRGAGSLSRPGPATSGGDGLRILVIGADKPGATDNHRVDALRRLGHEVDRIGPGDVLKRGWLVDRLRHRSGYRTVGRVVLHRLRRLLGGRTWDVIWVGGGREFGPASLRLLQRHGNVVISFNHDDPWGQRDGRLWDTYRRAVPLYDLVIVRRVENVAEAAASGAKNVLRIWLTYDEVVHARPPVRSEEPSRDVVFVGSWEPDRGALIAQLMDAGLDVAFWGNGWRSAPEWEHIRSAFEGPFVADERYTQVLSDAKVALGLISKGNRDLHTRRSVEVPALGTLLCAERTTEHELLLGDTALLWSTPAECVAQCQWAIEHPTERLEMVERARARVETLGLSNEGLMEAVLAFVRRGAYPAVWPSDLGTKP